VNELEKELLSIDRTMEKEGDYYFRKTIGSISTSAASSALKENDGSIIEKIKAGGGRKPRTPSTVESKHNDLLIEEDY